MPESDCAAVVEDLTLDEIRGVFEANVLGTYAVTQRVLPHMREAGRGRVITISSVAGKIASFGLSAYCATQVRPGGLRRGARTGDRAFWPEIHPGGAGHHQDFSVV